MLYLKLQNFEIRLGSFWEQNIYLIRTLEYSRMPQPVLCLFLSLMGSVCLPAWVWPFLKCWLWCDYLKKQIFLYLHPCALRLSTSLFWNTAGGIWIVMLYLASTLPKGFQRWPSFWIKVYYYYWSLNMCCCYICISKVIVLTQWWNALKISFFENVGQQCGMWVKLIPQTLKVSLYLLAWL